MLLNSTLYFLYKKHKVKKKKKLRLIDLLQCLHYIHYWNLIYISRHLSENLALIGLLYRTKSSIFYRQCIKGLFMCVQQMSIIQEETRTIGGSEGNTVGHKK